MDVFAGWNDYISRLENNWRKLVTDNDMVVVSGDISWAMKLEETLTDFTFIENLPGKKIFNKRQSRLLVEHQDKNGCVSEK